MRYAIGRGRNEEIRIPRSNVMIETFLTSLQEFYTFIKYHNNDYADILRSPIKVIFLSIVQGFPGN